MIIAERGSSSVTYGEPFGQGKAACRDNRRTIGAGEVPVLGLASTDLLMIS
jgi:hypothetical protein